MASHMTEIDKTYLASKYKTLAEEYLKHNSVEEAFTYFMLVLRYKPEWKNDIRNSFAETIYKQGLILEYDGRFKEIFVLYENALKLYEDNEVLYNNLGAHCFRLNQFKEAAHFLKIALQIDQNYLPAYKNYQIVKSHMMERWHFRMLNDSVRNTAYKKAISKKIKEGFDTILDIGVGTGLLSLYAKNAGAKEVYGCDYSETMIELATRVLQENFPEGSPVVLINKLSNNLSVPEDISKRLSLVITETFDGGLLGEHILQTLLHAWDCLLKPRTALDGSSVDRILPAGAILYATPLECLKIARLHTIIKCERLKRNSFQLGLNLSQINIKSNSEEPYDTEDLNILKGNYKYLSTPVKLLELNFNDPDELRKYYEGKKSEEVAIKIEKDGYLDGIAVWFDLILDSENVITSSPVNPDSCCWEQAIFPIQEEIFINKDYMVNISASCETGILSLNFNECNKTDLNTVLKLPSSVIKYLNCETILCLHVHIVDTLKRIHKNIEFVMDLSPFPYLGLLLARELDCGVIVSTQIPKSVLSTLEFNSAQEEKVVYRQFPELLEYLDNEHVELDAILVDILESTGEFKEETIVNLPRIRQHLKPDGVFMPLKFELWCRLIYSEQLKKFCQASNEELDQLNISKWINEYQVTTQVDTNINELDCENIAESVRVAVLENANLTSASVISFKTQVIPSKSGSTNGLVYWIQYQLIEEAEFSSLVTDSYLNQCVFMFQTELDCRTDQPIEIKCDYHSGTVRFSVNNNVNYKNIIM